MIEKEDKRKIYNSLKVTREGVAYSGMKIGGKHTWNYQNGLWSETKVAPDRWIFNYTSLKHRFHEAPEGTGALNNTKYHWYILADQKVNKIGTNTYETVMEGQKFKIAHKRPNWRLWNYQYKNIQYEDILINILEETLRQLKLKRDRI